MSGQKSKTLGLAFGGGGIRGMAHIGLVEELDRHGVRADFVAGTSIGSMMAAFYACGMRGEFMARLMQNINLKHILPISPSTAGLMNGKNYADFVRLLTRGRSIEETEIPLRIIATDLEAGRMEVFSDGPIWRAVHASSAVPGVFSPAEYRGRLYADGCLVDNCPCQTLRQLGADVVVGVDLDALSDGSANQLSALNKHNVIAVLQRSLNVVGRKNSSLDYADLVIRPLDQNIYSLDLSKADYALERGRKAAAASIDQILELLQ